MMGQLKDRLDSLLAPIESRLDDLRTKLPFLRPKGMPAPVMAAAGMAPPTPMPKAVAQPKPPRDKAMLTLFALTGLTLVGIGATFGWLLSDPSARDAGEPSVLAPLKPAPPAPKPTEEAEAAPVEVVPASPDEAIGQLRLRPVPNRALIEMGADGPLPIIAADGRRAYKVYARPANLAMGRPKVAVYVGGLGLNPKTAEMALARLPGQVTLGFSPLTNKLSELVAKARARGHEFVIDVAMEPADVTTNDPGPYTMMTSVSAAENIGRLEWLMSRAPGFIGIAATLGDKFMLDEGSARPVLESLRARGLMILDTQALPRSVVARLADGIGLPYGIMAVNLDEDPSPALIAQRLARLEELARVQGSAIGVAHAYPVTFTALDQWGRGLDQRNLQLAPVSALLVGGN